MSAAASPPGTVGQVRADNRLADLPMTPVECQTCRAVVDVRKASWQQTSVQWDERSTRLCAERAGEPPVAGALPSCAALRESISRAALSGDLDVAQP